MKLIEKPKMDQKKKEIWVNFMANVAMLLVWFF